MTRKFTNFPPAAQAHGFVRITMVIPADRNVCDNYVLPVGFVMHAHALPWPYPTLIAHRGGGRLAPENTLAGMRCGAEHGFTFVEYDVKLSRDNVLILLHDDTVNRTTDGSGLAADMSWDALSQLDAGSWHSAAFADERIPTFESVARYTQAHHIASNVEIKPCPGREHETGSAAALAARALWQNVRTPPLLSSFSEVALAAAHVAAPELPRALLVNEVPPDWHERLVRHDCRALNVNHKHVTEELVQAVHARGYEIAIYTVNDPSRAKLLLDWGVDGVFTDELALIGPKV